MAEFILMDSRLPGSGSLRAITFASSVFFGSEFAYEPVFVDPKTGFGYMG
jgi:hypothetical protein